MKYINFILFAAMLFISFGCATFDDTYMGSNEPKTRMECEMQHAKTVDKVIKGYKYVMTDQAWNSVVECAHLPETLW
jgi:hypothetical protein